MSADMKSPDKVASLTEAEVLDLIRGHLARAGSLTALAQEWGVSMAYIADLVRGRREPGPAILRALGLEKVKAPLTYREVAK